jgi:hypothetical protein
MSSRLASNGGEGHVREHAGRIHSKARSPSRRARRAYVHTSCPPGWGKRQLARPGRLTSVATDEDEHDEELSGERPELPSVVGLPTTELPAGYTYGVTRYADVILREAFPERFQQLVATLNGYRINLDELVKGGGSRATHTARFDETLATHGWGKRNITISRHIDGKLLHETPGHEIDMFAEGAEDNPYPGVAVEMEWNNKDPFYDRDLLNFQALHHEGAIAIGVIVTRGPRLQKLIGPTIKTGKATKSRKYGQSTTHWKKLIPRVNLGGGGDCPLLLVGIEPERIDGEDMLQEAFEAGEELY